MTPEEWKLICDSFKNSSITDLKMERMFDVSIEEKKQLTECILHNCAQHNLRYGSLRNYIISSIWAKPDSGMARAILQNKALLPTELVEDVDAFANNCVRW